MKIIVFLHGTAIMHKTGQSVSREERVRQVMSNDSSVLKYEDYVPVGNAVEKIANWVKQGAEIIYLSSHQDLAGVEKDKIVLDKYSFPKGEILFRQNGEQYKDVVERVMPDILVEDDCESIGGEKEMTYPNLSIDAKRKIKSIVVKEFQGIDHLSNEYSKLSSDLK